MKQKRIYVRVPLRGDAVLSRSSHQTIRAKTIDISQGGVAVTALSDEVSGGEYQIEIVTESGMTIEIVARLVRVKDSIAGFETQQINPKSREIINELIFNYQKTVDFIRQFDECDLQKVLDEEGNEIEITFVDDGSF